MVACCQEKGWPFGSVGEGEGAGRGSWAPQRAMALAVACVPSHLSKGSRHSKMEDAGDPWGFSGPLSLGGLNSPFPQGPDRGRRQQGGRIQVWWGGRLGRERLRTELPSGQASDGGGGGSVVRAGVQCGHEGHAQSPRVCVRAWGWPCYPLPRAGRAGKEPRGEGRADFPSARCVPGGVKNGLKGTRTRPDRGLFQRPRRGASLALLDDKAAGQVL